MNPDVRQSVSVPAPWRFACPICRHVLDSRSDELSCARCDMSYTSSSGIWRFLPEERAQHYRRFLHEYRLVREKQGWGRPDASYFLSLPDVARNDPQWEIWRRRRRSFAVLVSRVIEPMSAHLRSPLRVLDLGAGNCWLSHRLSQLGHHVAAIDVSDDWVDGLGAHGWYRSSAGTFFTPVQAEFDRLPLCRTSADIVVFNGSFHYSPEFSVTLREAISMLVPEGVVVILDSPVYRSAASGEAMVRERELAFERLCGCQSSELVAEQYLTWKRLSELANAVGVRWNTLALPGRAGSQLRGQLRKRFRALCGLRELATMPVIVGDQIPSDLRAIEP